MNLKLKNDYPQKTGYFMYQKNIEIATDCKSITRFGYSPFSLAGCVSS
jgi:hypothetical protein